MLFGVIWCAVVSHCISSALMSCYVVTSYVVSSYTVVQSMVSRLVLVHAMVSRDKMTPCNASHHTTPDAASVTLQWYAVSYLMPLWCDDVVCNDVFALFSSHLVLY